MCVAPCHPWHRDISPSRHLAINGGVLTSVVLTESWRCSNLEHPCSSHGQVPLPRYALRNISVIDAILLDGLALQVHTIRVWERRGNGFELLRSKAS
ncbi:MAG: hypothetical protein P4L59_08455 [Desulfosporosinus sp.]|nr:hypothetical protein [Desulfosporosinus sp.]